MSQIGLVTAEHDLGSQLVSVRQILPQLVRPYHNVGVGMIPQLLQPPRDVLVSLLLGDVVNEEGTHGAAVVGRCDGTVTLLTGGIPDLRLDGLVVDLNAARGELDADGGLAVQVELIAGESREQVGLSDTGVSYEHHLEQEIVFVVVGHVGGIVEEVVIVL